MNTQARSGVGAVLTASCPDDRHHHHHHRHHSITTYLLTLLLPIPPRLTVPLPPPRYPPHQQPRARPEEAGGSVAGGAGNAAPNKAVGTPATSRPRRAPLPPADKAMFVVVQETSDRMTFPSCLFWSLVDLVVVVTLGCFVKHIYNSFQGGSLGAGT